MSNQINIFAIDDHELFLSGLVSELEKITNFKIIGSSNNSKDAIDFFKKDFINIDIAIIDINLKENTTIFSHIEKIIANFSNIKIIVLSTYDGKKLMRQLKEIGAKAFVSKNDKIEDIVNVINKVYNNEIVFPKFKNEHLNDNFDLDAFEFKTQATKRELEILELISQGKNDKEIGTLLNISDKTAKKHRTNLREKLEAKSSAELIAKAIKLGIV